jgi:hypothetical protein
MDGFGQQLVEADLEEDDEGGEENAGKLLPPADASYERRFIVARGFLFHFSLIFNYFKKMTFFPLTIICWEFKKQNFRTINVIKSIKVSNSLKLFSKNND